MTKLKSLLPLKVQMETTIQRLEFQVLRLTIKFSDAYGICTDFLYKAKRTQNFKYKYYFCNEV